MFSAEELQAKFESQMQPTAGFMQTPAEGAEQNQPNPNNVPNSGATNNDVASYATAMKMKIADTLMPVEDDGTRRPSTLR